MVMMNHMKKTISIILLLLWTVAAYAEGIGTYKDLLEFAAASNSGQTLTNGKMPTASFVLRQTLTCRK